MIPGPRIDIPCLGGGFELVFVKPEKLIPLVFTYHNLVSREGGLLRLWIGLSAKIFVINAQSVEAVLANSKLLTKSIDYVFLYPWLRTGLLTSTGSKWQIRRKLLTPTFHFNILESFLNVFNEQSRIMVDILKQQPEGKTYNIYPFIARCTLDVICETAMGRHTNAQNEIDSPYIHAVSRTCQIMMKRQSKFLLQPDWLFSLSSYKYDLMKQLGIIHGFTNQVIQERKISYAEEKQRKWERKDSETDETFISKRKRLAFLDMLIESSKDGEVLSDADIAEEVDTFMFAGYDTTSVAIGFALFCIGSHPQVQERIQEELDEIFGNSNRPATMADLSKMKYLECCIKETLRLFPSVPFLGRNINKDTKINGSIIPAGSSVSIFTLFIHRDPKYFPNPELYDPERFFPENAQGRHPYAFIPFSAGQRNCIGQKFALIEQKVVLSTILRNFSIKSMDKREDLVLVYELVLKSANGINLQLTPRT